MTRPVRLVLSAVLLAILAAACVSGEADDPPDPAPGVEGSPPSEAASPSDPPAGEQGSRPPTTSVGLAVLDTSLPREVPHVTGECGVAFPRDCLFDDLRSITCDSDVAFIGRITGYIENLRTHGGDWVYDGLVFTVDELLKGDLKGSADEVTVAFIAGGLDLEGNRSWRMGSGPIEVVKQGIVKRNDSDGPSYLVYGWAAVEGTMFHRLGVFRFNTYGGVAQVLDDGSLRQGVDRPFRSGHGFSVDDAREAGRSANQLCVKPPLPDGVLDIWKNSTGLSANMDEPLWADRLDRVCKTALGGDIDSPVWDREVALALAEEFAYADGLRHDLSPESQQQFIQAAAGTLWSMVVQRAGPDEPSACWDRVPSEFLEAGPPVDSRVLLAGSDALPADEAFALLSERFDQLFSYDDLESITCASDLVFVGRVTERIPNLVFVPVGSHHYDYNGAVFVVEELLSGEIEGAANELTVAYWNNVYQGGSFLYQNTDGPRRVIRDGLTWPGEPDGPRYLVYASSAEEGSPFLRPGVFYFTTNGGVVQVMDDGTLGKGPYAVLWNASLLGQRSMGPFQSGHDFDLEDAREAAKVPDWLCVEPRLPGVHGASTEPIDCTSPPCVQPPLPPGTRELWFNEIELQLTVDERVWAVRLDRVCKTALGDGGIDSPVWDQEAALALAEEFAVVDGLNPDETPEFRHALLVTAARMLWEMIVHRAEPDGPSVCWDVVPEEFLADVPPYGTLPPDPYILMTDAAYDELYERFFYRRLWRVEPPLPPGTRGIWWEATGLRSTIHEGVWAVRLNEACNTPVEDPEWDRAAAAALAEKFIVEDGGHPTSGLVEAGADALWRMTAVPPNGACPWHFPPDTFEPDWLEWMRQVRRDDLNR